MKLAAHVADVLDDATAWWLRELGPCGEQVVLPIERLRAIEPVKRGEAPYR